MERYLQSSGRSSADIHCETVSYLCALLRPVVQAAYIYMCIASVFVVAGGGILTCADSGEAWQNRELRTSVCQNGVQRTSS